MNYSILMSIYFKEKASYLVECLQSISKQSLPPGEVVIVEDGPLTEELYQVLTEFSDSLPIKRVVLAQNVGLGSALNEGFNHCNYDFIARMDTDDICHPERFEKQLAIMLDNDVDVCGCWVGEFDSCCDVISGYRKTPVLHDDIIKYASSRNPLNHPSVMYKKQVVLSVNGYEDVLFFEDYHLWLKLIVWGASFYNIPAALVLMRAGTGQISRRRGLRYALFEFDFFKRCMKEKLLTPTAAIKNIILRFPLRLLPSNLLKSIYIYIRGKNK